MKLIYVAGPYRADTIWGIRENIDAATRVARELWLMGAAVICPHANSAFMDGHGTDSVFLNGDLEILARCDAIVMLPGWERSKGAKAEMEFAAAHGLQVFEWNMNHANLDIACWIERKSFEDLLRD